MLISFYNSSLDSGSNCNITTDALPKLIKREKHVIVDVVRFFVY